MSHKMGHKYYKVFVPTLIFEVKMVQNLPDYMVAHLYVWCKWLLLERVLLDLYGFAMVYVGKPPDGCPMCVQMQCEWDLLSLGSSVYDYGHKHLIGWVLTSNFCLP